VTIANSGGNVVGPLTINGGTVRIGNNTAAGGGLGSYGSASVASGATLALAPAAGDSLTFAGVISGAGNVAHNGAGKTTLSGANTYTGSTDITAGTVVVTNNNSFGPITAGASPVNVSGTGQIDIAGVTGVSALDFGTNKVFNIAGSGPGRQRRDRQQRRGLAAERLREDQPHRRRDHRRHRTLRPPRHRHGPRQPQPQRQHADEEGHRPVFHRPQRRDRRQHQRRGRHAPRRDLLEHRRQRLDQHAAGLDPVAAAHLRHISRPIALNGATISDSNQTADQHHPEPGHRLRRQHLRHPGQHRLHLHRRGLLAPAASTRPATASSCSPRLPT
jgi:autotransporter-associated beta strand protein